INNNPGEWRFYHYLGFIYWQSKDFKKAAESYKKGSEIAGSPSWMRKMAAKMTERGGERDTARAIYQQLFEQAEDSQTKANAKIRLLQLDSLDERDAINTVLNRIKSEKGSCPAALRSVLPGLQNMRLPNGKEFRINKDRRLVDPSNVLYLLDKQSCKAVLDPEKSRIPLK
ncbi:MAG: hypothetical protein HKN25_10550, partial [Pyrinomonadaceae bacterium]|nr:hypothetical protein [Pyrinomonadaceae bacterium]